MEGKIVTHNKFSKVDLNKSNEYLERIDRLTRELEHTLMIASFESAIPESHEVAVNKRLTMPSGKNRELRVLITREFEI